MELLTRSRERRRIALAVVVLVLALLISLAYTIVSSRAATDAAVESMSEVYLQELSDQVISHFNTGIDGKFCQIETVRTSLSLCDPRSVEEVEGFLDALEADDEDCSYLALRGSDGRYYTARGVTLDSREGTAEHGSASLTYRDSDDRSLALYDGTIALIASFEPMTCGDMTFTAVIAGFDVDVLSRQLNLDLFGNSRSSVIGRDGTCIVGCGTEGLEDGGNLLDALERYAHLDGGYSMERVRAKLRNDEACIVPFTYGEHHEYLYLRPMGDADWYLCTAMPYSVVDRDIAELGAVLLQNAGVMALVILLVIGIFFSIYYRLVKRNTRLLSDERDRAERASEEARRASMAKSEFLSRMSHEIRTPMNGIMGMTAIALEHAPDAKTRVCLEKIAVTSKHLMALINDILDMSKIESGKIDIKRETFDFRALVDSIGSVFSTQAGEQGIRFAIEERGALPAHLVGDGLRLNQIIYNLLGNAFKFTPQGGRVALSIEALSKRVREDSGRADSDVWLRLSVTDTGCGIEPENFDRIFSSFEQGDEASRMRGGTGLGLAITKRFVEMMGGSIELASEVGKGSTFTVEMPFGLAANGAPANRGDTFPTNPCSCEDADYDFTGARVVIAEDNELNREIATEVIAMTGAEVIAVSTGTEAVAAFERSEPGSIDLILMDIQMPEMDGYEATIAIRSLPRDDARSVPIVAMTANAFIEDEERSRMSGMDGHLSKPLDIRLVYATIDGFLRARPRSAGA